MFSIENYMLQIFVIIIFDFELYMQDFQCALLILLVFWHMDMWNTPALNRCGHKAYQFVVKRWLISVPRNLIDGRFHALFKPILLDKVLHKSTGNR